MPIAEEEFIQLYETHRSGTLQRFRKRGCSVEDAEDLTQMVYANAYKGRHALDDISKWRYWLHRIERSVWSNHHRRLHTLKRHASEIPFDETIDHGGDSEDALTSLLAKEEQADLRAAIEGLPEKCQEVFTFYYHHCMSIREISSLCQISPNTVKTHLHHARNKLIEQLGQGEEP